MAKLNGEHLRDHAGEPDLSARIESFELAYRMQTEATELIDLSKETAATRAMYGLDDPKARSFGTKCLTARRLVERGVRFVQVYSDGEWDAHADLAGNHTGHCAATDVPIDGLLTDLKRRGLLDSTLVIWGGEFGRMPVSQGNGGRDHNPHGFLVWMAGAGIKGGASHGETDEFGHRAVTDRVSVHDLHATMLHLLGVDHKKLTYFHNGRQYRLTDVAGEVLKQDPGLTATILTFRRGDSLTLVREYRTSLATAHFCCCGLTASLTSNPANAIQHPNDARQPPRLAAKSVLNRDPPPKKPKKISRGVDSHLARSING